MSIYVTNPGLQTTLQGAPYCGHRHIAMPAAGAADCLSLGMANRLVGNDLDELALEISLNGVVFRFGSTAIIALTGAICDFKINNQKHLRHQAIKINAGDEISIGSAQKGCRSYLAIGGGFNIAPILDGRSTYQAAKLGGHEGRALRKGDILELRSDRSEFELDRTTPQEFVPTHSDSVILRVTTGPDFDQLDDDSKNQLFECNWNIDTRMSRMGLLLAGSKLQTVSNISMQSAPVFPGTIQCPPNGSPFLLGPDAQTTGGYPRIAQVILADRHLIGQLKPDSKVQLVRTTADLATRIYRGKLALLKPWLGEFKLW